MQKIMFNDRYGLTQAVLEGRKTMTRRSVSDKILNKYQDYLNWWNTQKGGFKVPEDEFYLCESPYKVNDVIAIAQAYKDVNCGGCDVDCRYDSFRTAYSVGGVRESDKGWNNKMFAKSSLMPHHIKITDIKVERLQACSDDDILKEGVFQISAPIYRHSNGIGYTFKGWTERGVECSSDTPKGAFKALIDKNCGRGTFESNPYVFAYSFKLLD